MYSVSQLFLAEAIGKTGRSHIQRLTTPANLSSQFFSAYAISESGKGGRRSEVKRLALINMQFVNSTIPDDGSGKSVEIDINDWLPKGDSVKVKRMSAPGIDVQDADLVTWAGQAWTNGTAKGDEQIENVEGGVVHVKGSEGVLVFL